MELDPYMILLSLLLKGKHQKQFSFLYINIVCLGLLTLGEKQYHIVYYDQTQKAAKDPPLKANEPVSKTKTTSDPPL